MAKTAYAELHDNMVLQMEEYTIGLHNIKHKGKQLFFRKDRTMYMIKGLRLMQ